MAHEGWPVETNIAPIGELGAEQYEDDKPQDECGVFGIWAPGAPVGRLTYDALYGLQHRGQSGAGVAIQDLDTQLPMVYKGADLLPMAVGPDVRPDSVGVSRLDVMNPEASVALGHTRYSTADSDEAAQPFMGRRSRIALAHNGHIEDIDLLAFSYNIQPPALASDSLLLTEVVDVRAEALGSVDKALDEILPHVEGAYCLTVMDGDRLIGVRDPWGFHPLSLGKMRDRDGFVLASESVIFKSIGAEFVRDIEPGEIITIDKEGISSRSIKRREQPLNCMFEYIYIARADGIINGVDVYTARRKMGEFLAIDQPVEADIVVGVPDTGMDAAQGYADASGLRLAVRGLMKNPYAGRTFIERGGKRAKVLDDKHRPNRAELVGQRVVLVDDSMIKGSTMTKLVHKVREAGAREVHLRFPAPEFRYSCYAGLDTRDAWRLIAQGRTLSQIASEVGADSVAFGTPDRIMQAVREARVADLGPALGGLCMSCHTGEYPFSGPTFIGRPEIPVRDSHARAPEVYQPTLVPLAER